MAQYAPVESTTLSTKVELRISCKNLRDADVFSKSDPLVAVYTPSSSKSWNEVPLNFGLAEARSYAHDKGPHSVTTYF